jgi:isoquinoline 1-oxidoreductase subunit alpha
MFASGEPCDPHRSNSGEAAMTELTVNGKVVQVDAAPETALLSVLREHLGLTGTKYGCAHGQCGACMVHVDGRTVFSCLTPVERVAGRAVTTIEGLDDHPLQRAWVAEQVPQCGYCQSGQIMRAAVLLAENKKPTREQIVNHMNTNLCRCGTYLRIIRAIQRASRES